MSKTNKKNKSVKSNKNTEPRGVGAPKKPVNYNKRGKFTVSETKALNPDVCGLTVITRINDLVDEGVLVKLKEPQKTGKAGRPSFVYMTKAVYDAAQARKKNKTESPEVETPISPEPVNTGETQAVITETPAETPVVASVEAPAETSTPEAVAVGGEPVAA